MGLIDDFTKRVGENLKYKAENEVTSGIVNAVSGKLGKKSVKACPKCKKPIQEGLKFCAECGTKLIATCSQCNVDYPIGTKFCTQCGKPIK